MLVCAVTILTDRDSWFCLEGLRLWPSRAVRKSAVIVFLCHIITIISYYCHLISHNLVLISHNLNFVFALHKCDNFFISHSCKCLFHNNCNYISQFLRFNSHNCGLTLNNVYFTLFFSIISQLPWIILVVWKRIFSTHC